MIRFARGPVAAASLCLILVACGGGGSGAPSTPPTQLPDSVSIQSTAAAETGTEVDFATSLTTTTGVTFEWTYGDGTTGTGATTTHVYPRAGKYTAGVTVANSAGDTRTATFDVDVAAFGNVHGLSCTNGEGVGWCWQDANVTPHHINQFSFLPASSDGWAVGTGGAILATTNGGDNWTAQVSGVTTDLVDVRFYDATHGIALSNAAFLLKTADGGKTWTRVALTGLTSLAPTIAAFDATQIVVTSADMTLVSHDDGATWSTSTLAQAFVAGTDCWSVSTHTVQLQTGCIGTPATVLPAANSNGVSTFTGYSFYGATRVLVMGEFTAATTGVTTQYAWTSATVGAHWTRTASNLGKASLAVQMTDYTHAYAFDTTNTAWLSADIGTTWTAVKPPADMADPAIPRLQGVLPALAKLWIATPTRMAMSLDAINWQEIAAPDAATADGTEALPRVVRWSDAQNIVASRGGTLYTTHDGGTTWKRVLGAEPRDAGVQASALAFRDTKHGLLALGNGSLQSTADGGQTWTRQATGTGVVQNVAAQFTSAQDGWLMQSGWISRTTDGGATWSKATVPVALQGSARLMSWGDAMHGWAAAWSDSIALQIFSTKDGGTTWSATAIPNPSVDFASMVFADAMTGVIMDTGTDGTIWHTADGGATWTNVGHSTTGNVVRHTGTKTFWVGGSGGTHLTRSTDGGATWSVVTLPVALAAQPDLALAGADDAHAWLATQGAVLTTADAGATWSSTAVPADAAITSLFAYDDETLWGATAEGPLLATATGGN
jgi:photosystem II stability/assembly factor-like uncharacterized protein